jgi:uncharacterized protein HemY
MEDKEVFVGIFEMLEYSDVLRHIVEYHGPEGKEMIQNQEELPTIWHELDHLKNETNHIHLSNHREAAQMIVTTLDKVYDPDVVEEFKELVQGEVYQKENEKVQQYLDQLSKG